MYKLPLFVFKLLGTSILLMLLLDTSLMVIETISVHSKVSSLTGIMQQQVSEHNSMPSEMAELFETQLNEIVDVSSVADAQMNNMTEPMFTADKNRPGAMYHALDGSVIEYNYGDLADLYIAVRMRPSILGLVNPRNEDGALLGRSNFEYMLTYHYSVPCLRSIQ